MKRRGIDAHGLDQLAAEVSELVRSARILERCELARAFFTRIERFVEELATWASRINLTAHPDDPEELAFHILDSLAPLYAFSSKPLLHPESRILDLGSGAGFPGLVLAAAIDANFTLVEARRKRASFLSVAVSRMDLHNAAVRCERLSAETVETGFDVVTSRAVGEKGFEIAGRALRPGGCAMLWTNPGRELNLARAEHAGLRNPERHEYRVPRGNESSGRELIILRRR